MTGAVVTESVGAGADRDAITRRKFVLGGIFAATVGGAMLLRPRAVGSPVGAGTLDRVLPRRVPPYVEAGTSDLIAPVDSDLAALTYSDILMRLYRRDDAAPIMLLVACGAGREPGLAVHRPEECYPAFGYDVSPLRPVPMGTPLPPGMTATFFTARRDDRVEHVLYWVRLGAGFPASNRAQRLAVARENLRGRLPEGVLLRVSTIGGEASVALEALRGFAGGLLAHLDTAGREILLGHG
ncbi:methanolan biosynthesis EpsI [Novosphingobium nitrogenifigens DSM 19370]|uniref:Methanolan biosynthesis EpsI n=1 Tax=Novosphingobium nitrogenifigens DSM 19370 TaxID=983920 RepID=F1Z551_9SPHN|nr:exosortase C-terminal domain/associated protein EpsI [Novosphingobium nitrogenifigens]EGD60016.1 methanolan biosynthesis EpsI [Novosphingobium nitrogenifigens DSM 19370]